MSRPTTAVRQLPIASRQAKQRQPLWARLGAALVILGVTIYRMVVARDAVYPGHADPAFYYQVARDLSTGHGPDIDYVWHFLTPVSHVRHFAWDYWLPMPSLLMSVGQFFRSGMSSALDVGIAITAIFAAGTYQLAGRLTRTWWIPPVASVTVLLLHSVSLYAMRTESAVYLAAFSVLAMSAAVGAREQAWRWPLAGAFTGIAGLARNEGLLLIAVMAVAALAWNQGRNRWIRLATLLAGYLAIMGPYVVVSIVHIGSPLPPASQKFPYISQYDQLFALHVKQSWSVLVSNAMWNARAQAFIDQWQFGKNIYGLGVLSALLALTVVSFAFGGHRDWFESISVGRALRSPWLVPVSFALLVPIFESIVTPVVADGGSVQKSGIALAPVLVIGALHRSRRLPGLRPDGPRWMRSWAWLAQLVAIGGALTLMIFPAVQLSDLSLAAVAGSNSSGAQAHHLAPALRAEQRLLGGRKLVLMTANPWDVTQATGFPTVAVPSAPLCSILATARRFGVTDIETRQGNRPRSDVGWLAHHGGPFTSVAGDGLFHLYRIQGWSKRWCDSRK